MPSLFLRFCSKVVQSSESPEKLFVLPRNIWKFQFIKFLPYVLNPTIIGFTDFGVYLLFIINKSQRTLDINVVLAVIN